MELHIYISYLAATHPIEVMSSVQHKHETNTCDYIKLCHFLKVFLVFLASMLHIVIQIV